MQIVSVPYSSNFVPKGWEWGLFFSPPPPLFFFVGVFSFPDAADQCASDDRDHEIGKKGRSGHEDCAPGKYIRG